jgi:hypothetical protein
VQVQPTERMSPSIWSLDAVHMSPWFNHIRVIPTVKSQRSTRLSDDRTRLRQDQTRRCTPAHARPRCFTQRSNMPLLVEPQHQINSREVLEPQKHDRMHPLSLDWTHARVRFSFASHEHVRQCTSSLTGCRPCVRSLSLCCVRSRARRTRVRHLHYK